MSRTTCKLTTISACALLAASLSSTNAVSQDYDEETMRNAEPPVADTMVTGVFIDFMAHVAFERAVVRVSGPKGYSATIRVPAGTSAITADLLLDAEPAEYVDSYAYASETDGSWHTLPDGEYRYELDLISGNRLIGRETGTFLVDGGVASDDSYGSVQSSTLFQRIAGAAFDLLIPSANAQVLTTDNWLDVADASNNDQTYIRYENDSDISGNWWRVGNNDGRYRWAKGNFFTTQPAMTLVGDNTPPDGRLGIGTTNPLEQLHLVNSANFAALRLDNSETTYRVRSGADGFSIRQVGPNRTPFTIQDGAPSNSIVIDSGGAIGIGTSSPAAPLHIAAGFPGIQMNNAGKEWRFSAFSDGYIGFRVSTGGALRHPFVVHGDAPSLALTVTPSGDVGVGTASANSAFHVRRTNGTAQVLVEETSSGDATLFELSNNGHSRFIFRDTSTSNLWEFRTAGADNFERFQINRLGSGELEFQVRKGGNAFFAGDVTANGVLLTSTREAKTDFAPLDANDVLDRLASLEISKWRYKHESEDTVHFGPVAEEFHEIFGLSDGKHLNMIDTNGITFAAIQALNQRNQELMTRLEQLESAQEL